MTVYVLNTNQSVIGPGQSVNPGNQAGSANPPTQTVQVDLQGTGLVSATLSLQGSNDGVNYISVVPAMTLSVAASPQFASATYQNVWQFYRCNVTALTGALSSVTTYMAC